LVGSFPGLGGLAGGASGLTGGDLGNVEELLFIDPPLEPALDVELCDIEVPEVDDPSVFTESSFAALPKVSSLIASSLATEDSPATFVAAGSS
jgi:hypothetical protein